jgi:phosphoserine phosphatase
VDDAMTTEHADPARVIALLEQARQPGASGLTFDADGTLWSGDVGEDVFDSACEEGLLREEARPGLVAVAEAHALPTAGTPSELARAIHQAYRRGLVDELLTCEVMTWGYAGLTTTELVDFARHALTRKGLAARLHAVLAPMFDFARREGLRVIVVSASPALVVAEGLRLASIEVDELAGAPSAVEGGRIVPGLAGRVPYGPEKVIVGKRLLTGHDWLGTFGDNAFDAEMLRAARIGVAVHPKPALRARLAELPNTVVLE